MADRESWRRYDATSLDGILRSALAAFAEYGYGAASIRDIASGCGLSVPGVYHHYPSKQQILVTLMETVLNDLLTRARAAIESAPAEPSARFHVLAECLIRFHMFRRREAFVASTELRSLEPEARAACVALRDAVQQLVAEVIEEGCAIGVFNTPYPDDAARAVSTLCVGIASWYHEGGPLLPDDVVRRQLILLRGLLNAHGRHDRGGS